MKPFALLLVLMFAGCATRPKQYAAPNPAKVNAATAQVKKDSAKSHDLADAIILISNDLDQQSNDILAKAPPELKPQVLELAKGFDGLHAKENELEQHLKLSDQHVAELEKQQADYFANAQLLANDATDERNKRIAAEQKLSWYRWHWWASWAILGAGVIACIVFAVIKWGAKWSAKVAVAAGKVGI